MVPDRLRSSFRAIGHQHVIVEIDLHPKTLGVTSIIESEFGAIMRSLV